MTHAISFPCSLVRWFAGSLLFIAPAAADTRSEVQAVLDSMSRAVLAGDKAAYLAHADLSDPDFAAEQTHWADDLDRHVPAAFELSIIDDDSAPPDPPHPDRARFTLRVCYTSLVGHAKVEGGKQATWPALFLRKDPDADGPLPPRWLYAGEDWLEIHGAYGDHAAGTAGTFTIKHFPGSEDAARDILAAFPDAKAHADEGFEVNITRHLQIKLYGNMEHLKAWVYLSMPDEILGGWNEPGESIKFMAAYTKGIDRWRGAFAHEYAHVATWEFGPGIKQAPWWVSEGVAELCAEHFVKDRRRIDRMFRARAGQGALIDWNDISDYDTTQPHLKIFAYYQGHHIMGYVSERWGRPGRNRWLRAMGAGETLDEATRTALGIPFADLDAAWRTSLK